MWRAQRRREVGMRGIYYILLFVHAGLVWLCIDLAEAPVLWNVWLYLYKSGLASRSR